MPTVPPIEHTWFEAIAGGVTGNADLLTYFLRRMANIAASIGTLATNTVSQGETRDVGLACLTSGGWIIQRSVKSEPWPNEASLEIAKVWMSRNWSSSVTSDGKTVARITSSLDPATRVSGAAQQLAKNSGQLFYASLVNGIGFVLDAEEAASLLEQDSRNEDVLFPYVGGEDLNGDPSHQGSRWIINFRDWPLERAMTYPLCLNIVRQRVKPVRDQLPASKRRVRDNWWRYEHEAASLYERIRSRERVIAIASTSRLGLPARAPAGQVFAHSVYVFGYDDNFHFGVLTGAPHWWWAITRASTMRTDLRYTPTSCFETFPQPLPLSDRVAEAGDALDRYRSRMMLRDQVGLTKIYNRVHNPRENVPDIVRLRELHIELDHAVRDAYGWAHFELDHHHWETQQGMRFTVSREAKDELLDLLLELNHERYAAEVAAGLHGKQAKKTSVRGTGKGADTCQGTLL